MFIMNRTREIIVGALLIAAGLALPSLFHMFAMGGRIFLPMHIPVLLAGLLISPPMALLVGALTPLLSSILTGMPPAFPTMVVMMFELGSFGLIVSLARTRFNQSTYPALIIGILSGRIISALVMWFIGLFIQVDINPLFYVVNNIVTGLPGIIIQLILVPALAYAIRASRLDLAA